AIVEVGRALGRGRAGLMATATLDRYALQAAAAVVVRGTGHQELLAARRVRAEFIPDGVSVDRFASNQSVTRPAGTPLTIGLVGSSVWSPTRETCYGWDLVEVVRLLKYRMAVRGVLIGDGSGIEILRRRCHEHQIEDEIEFVGRVPYDELPRRLRGIDI